MAKVIPVLGPAGFTSDLTIKADEALSNFYITQRTQSDMYRHSISSLGSIIVETGMDEMLLENKVRSTLESYLGKQFDQVDLTVSTSVNPSGGIDLQISAILRDGEKTIDIHHVVTAKDSRIRSIINLQNEGRPFIHADLL